MTLRFPKLTTYQKDVYDWLGCELGKGKIAVVKSVRQSGKSFLALTKLIQYATQNKNTKSMIFEPTVANARSMYDMMIKALEQTNIIKSSNSMFLNIQLINGSEIVFRSPQQGVRGYTISGLLILDECAYLGDEEIFTILPFINAKNASMLICSTPFTQQGYFYEMFIKGIDTPTETLKSFDWSKEKEISKFLTEEKKQLYKQTMSRAKYKTEIEGEFLSDDGLLFQNISNCINDNPTKPNFLYIGIDFATGSDNDYTVLTAFNEKGEMYKQYRTNSLTPMQQIEWLSNIINELNSIARIHKILAEENSIGKVYIDALKQKIPTPITNWTTTQDSKHKLVTTFQIALENEKVTILNNPILLNELSRYECTVSKNNKFTYNGANGCHDDTVISTMLAYYSLEGSKGNYTIQFNKKITNKKSLAEQYG